ncbi:YciI family protein [Nonomuraea sp. SBT364]|uniref:YciI family protein n=1 Tax=Nonomuraea sp. SBT364 TaxID=1580530 RepID=UPI00066D99EF|nr:YciI family protein [Nonomuraea sp. SBT364]
MKYLMFVCSDTQPDTDKTDWPDVDVWVAENDARGRRVRGAVLAPETAATTVRVREGELILTDGPFAETKEVIVGFDLLDCADLDEAIEVARTHPMARAGRLELRPFADFEQ